MKAIEICGSCKTKACGTSECSLAKEYDYICTCLHRCVNCKQELVSGFEEPCRSCLEEDDYPYWEGKE